MANQHTARRAQAQQDDAPDLGPEPIVATPEQVADVTQGQAEAPATIMLTRDELDAMMADTAERAIAGVTQRLASQSRPVVNVMNATGTAPQREAVVPDAPTYEPAFVPTPEDFKRADDADKAGLVYDEPMAQAATIIVNGPNGDSVECTPKVFRTLLAAQGYVAHPEDAKQHLHAPTARRRRGGQNLDDPEPTVASRRRRRIPAAEQ